MPRDDEPRENDSHEPSDSSEVESWKQEVRRRLAAFERKRARLQAQAEAQDEASDPRYRPTPRLDGDDEPDDESAHPDVLAPTDEQPEGVPQQHVDSVPEDPLGLDGEDEEAETPEERQALSSLTAESGASAQEPDASADERHGPAAPEEPATDPGPLAVADARDQADDDVTPDTRETTPGVPIQPAELAATLRSLDETPRLPFGETPQPEQPPQEHDDDDDHGARPGVESEQEVDAIDEVEVEASARTEASSDDEPEGEADIEPASWRERLAAAMEPTAEPEHAALQPVADPGEGETAADEQPSEPAREEEWDAPLENEEQRPWEPPRQGVDKLVGSPPEDDEVAPAVEVGRRLLAYAVDLSLVLFASSACLAFAAWRLSTPAGELLRQIPAPFLLLFLLFDLILLTLSLRLAQATPGQALLGLSTQSVVDDRIGSGAALLRAVLLLAGTLALGLAGIAVLLDAHGRGFVDRIAGTEVVERGS